MNWKNRSKHDKGVIIRTLIVVFIMTFCGCFLDSEDYMTFFVILIAGCVYMTAFSIVNRGRW